MTTEFFVRIYNIVRDKIAENQREEFLAEMITICIAQGWDGADELVGEWPEYEGALEKATLPF